LRIEFDSDWAVNLVTMDRNSCTPLNQVWLLLHRFSHDLRSTNCQNYPDKECREYGYNFIYTSK